MLNVGVSAVSSLMKEGFSRLTSGQTTELTLALRALTTATATANPAAGIFVQMIVTTLAQQKVLDLGARADRKLSKVIGDLETDSDRKQAVLIRVLRVLAWMLPDGDQLEDACFQAARGDPEALIHLLEDYQQDHKRQQLETAVTRVLTGDFEDLIEEDGADDDFLGYLQDSFGVDSREEALALFLNVRRLLQAREVHETLQTVYDIENRLDAVNDSLEEMREELDDRLADLVGRLDRFLEAEIKNQGFDRLTPEYFDRQHPTDAPAICWLSGFELVDVHAGYALERTYETDAGDRRNVVSEFVDRLHAGDDLVVLGNPGAGKSTICRQVAAHWVENRYGTVLYRTEDTPNPFTATGTVEEYIAGIEDDVLVVIEDAPTVAEKTAALLKRFGTDSDVAFLLEASKSEWETENTTVTDPGIRDLKRMNPAEEDVPKIDELEIERAIDRFETTSAREVPLSPQELFDEIDRIEGIGGMYLLGYRLASHTLDPMHIEGEFSLYSDVIGTHTLITDTPEDLASEVGLIINLLNAAGIGVYPELVHSLAGGHEAHQRIDAILDRIDGRMLFGRIDDKYRPHHPFWSVLYLKHAFVENDRRAVHRFETCINSLFALVDDEGKRERIKQWLRYEPPYLEKIAADSYVVADELVEHVFKLGRDYPVLAPLFGPSEFSRIEFPEVCPRTSVFDTVVWRGQMYLARGEMDHAEQEFEQLNELATDSELPDVNASVYYEAVSLYNLGLIALRRGDPTANEYLDRSRELFDDLSTIHDSIDEIFANMDLSDHKAPGYHLAVFGQSTVFGQSEYSDAFEKAQDILSNIHTTEAEIDPVDMSIIEYREKARDARKRGDLEAAEEFLRESRKAFHKANTHGRFDWFQETVLREFPSDGFLDRYRHDTFLEGDAVYLNDLGEIVLERDQTDPEAAERYFRRSLELSRETGFRDGEAKSLVNLGGVARYRGDSETARDRFQRAAEIFMDTDSVPDALDAIEKLINVCKDIGERETAHKWCHNAIELAGQTELDERYRDFVALREQL